MLFLKSWMFQRVSYKDYRENDNPYRDNDLHPHGLTYKCFVGGP